MRENEKSVSCENGQVFSSFEFFSQVMVTIDIPEIFCHAWTHLCHFWARQQNIKLNGFDSCTLPEIRISCEMTVKEPEF